MRAVYHALDFTEELVLSWILISLEFQFDLLHGVKLTVCFVLGFIDYSVTTLANDLFFGKNGLKLFVFKFITVLSIPLTARILNRIRFLKF